MLESILLTIIFPLVNAGEYFVDYFMLLLNAGEYFVSYFHAISEFWRIF